MRTTLSVLAITMVAACSGSGTSSPRPEPVQVVDHGLVPVEGVEVLSSLDGRAVGVAVTASAGIAWLVVPAGGELTAFRRDGYHIGITTVLGAPVPRIPIERGDEDAPLATLSVAVSASGDVTGLVRTRAGSCDGYGQIGGTGTVEVFPECVHADGTVSLSVLAVSSAYTLRGVAVLPDLALDAPPPAAMLLATSQVATTDVALSVLALDTSLTSSWSVRAVRKGQAIGYESAGFGSGPIDATARLFGVASVADGIRASVMEGFFFDERSITTQRTSLGAISLDGAMLLRRPIAAELVEEDDGGFAIQIEDPVAQGTSTQIQLYWNDGSVVSHNWFIIAPPPSAPGVRRIPLPRLPEAMRHYALDLGTGAGFIAGYVDEDWITDYRLDPLGSFTRPAGAWTRREAAGR